MSQQPWPPQVGQIANGHQWNGTQWVPLPSPQQVPQVGQVANGHRGDGRQWVPLPQQAPQVGTIANGHRWDGRQWVPLAAAPAARVHPVLAELRTFAEAWVFDWSQQSDAIVLSRVVAERKQGASAPRVEYRARVRVDDAAWEVRFADELTESGGTPSATGAPAGSPAESIEQQAERLGANYPIDFRYDMVRDQVRGIAEGAHYTFRYGPW